MINTSLLCEQVFWLSGASPSTSGYKASTLSLLALHLESLAVATLAHNLNPKKLNNYWLQLHEVFSTCLDEIHHDLKDPYAIPLPHQPRFEVYT
jgi:hypothetical protein